MLLLPVFIIKYRRKKVRHYERRLEVAAQYRASQRSQSDRPGGNTQNENNQINAANNDAPSETVTDITKLDPPSYDEAMATSNPAVYPFSNSAASAPTLYNDENPPPYGVLFSGAKPDDIDIGVPHDPLRPKCSNLTSNTA